MHSNFEHIIIYLFIYYYYYYYYYITIIVIEPRAGYFQECQSQRLAICMHHAIFCTSLVLYTTTCVQYLLLLHLVLCACRTQNAHPCFDKFQIPPPFSLAPSPLTKIKLDNIKWETILMSWPKPIIMAWPNWNNNFPFLLALLEVTRYIYIYIYIGHIYMPKLSFTLFEDFASPKLFGNSLYLPFYCCEWRWPKGIFIVEVHQVPPLQRQLRLVKMQNLKRKN